MSDTSAPGVLYTEHVRLRSATPMASLWTYESCARGRDRAGVAVNADGSHEYWLERFDPLLNTILPGTGVSLIVNVGEPWAAGRSLSTTALLPRIAVVGPVTQARILRVGRSVRALGAGVRSTLTRAIFGVPASELVDKIVPLDELWSHDDVERLSPVVCGSGRACASALRDVLLARIRQPAPADVLADSARRLIAVHGGRVSIETMARSYGLPRQQFSSRFGDAAGLPPKLFARITRFQALVNMLLSTDATKWATLSFEAGFYDQAHMINEFRTFAGAPPTTFFKPHTI